MGLYDCYVIGEWLDKNNFNTNMICPISWIFKFLEENDCVILTDLLGTNVRSKLQDHSNPCFSHADVYPKLGISNWKYRDFRFSFFSPAYLKWFSGGLFLCYKNDYSKHLKSDNHILF